MKELSKINLLKEKLEKSISEFDEKEAENTFNELISELMREKNYYQAVVISIEMQAFYKTVENKKKEIETIILMANIFFNLQFYLLSLKSSNMALNLLNDYNDDFLKAKVLTILGKSISLLNQYEKALKNLLSAKDIIEKNKKKLYSNLDSILEYAKLLEDIANVYLKLKQDKNAREFFIKSLNEYKKIENTLGISKILNNIALTYTKEDKDTEYAKKFMKEAFEIADKNKLIKHILSYINGINSIFENITEYDNAMKFYKQVLSYKDISDNMQIKAIILKFMGIFYFKKKIYNKAINYLKKSLEIAKSLKLLYEQKDILLTLSEIYKEQRDYKNSLDYYIKYSEINDLINKRKMYFNISIIESEYKAYNKLLKNNKMLQKHKIILMQKSKSESLGQMASGIAHELNQPLGAISFALDNIYYSFEKGKLTNEYFRQKYIIIKNNISRINKIINQIRTFSRYKNFYSLEQLNLNDLISNLLLLMQTQIKNHNIILKLELKEDIGTVIASKNQIEQVILNFLSNAIYAVEKKYELTNSDKYKKMILIKTYSDKHNIYLEVEDNGIGISKDHIDKVFEPFFTTKEVNEGSGLGLSISYGIIQKMNGNLEIKSIKNKYTKVIVSLPKFKTKNKD